MQSIENNQPQPNFQSMINDAPIGHQRAVALGISGPDGAGKGYLTEKAFESLGVRELMMLTTRPHRPNDTKISISDQEFDDLLNQGVLVGAHTNDNGYRYAYHINDFLTLQGGAIIELNPVFQQQVKEELESYGIKFAGWLGIIGNEEYLEENIRSREPHIDNDQLSKKLTMGKKIVEMLKTLEQESNVTLFLVGWHNRETMSQEFTDTVKKIMFEP